MADTKKVILDEIKEYIDGVFGGYIDEIRARINHEKFDFQGIGLFLKRTFNLLPGQAGIKHAQALLESVVQAKTITGIIKALFIKEHELGERSRHMVVQCLVRIFKLLSPESTIQYIKKEQTPLLADVIEAESMSVRDFKEGSTELKVLCRLQAWAKSTEDWNSFCNRMSDFSCVDDTAIIGGLSAVVEKLRHDLSDKADAHIRFRSWQP